MEEKLAIGIVDDEETIIDFLKIFIEEMGYKAIEATTATEMLGKIRKSPEEVACLLIDIMMPGINGIELLKIIKKEFPDIICITLTGYPTLDNAIATLSEGAFAYLVKPINPVELKITLKNAIELFELRKSKKEIEYVPNRTYVVLSKNEKDNIIKINKAFSKLLGYSNEEDLVGKSLSNIFPAEYMKSYIQRLVEENEVRDFPMWLKNRNGKVLNLKFSGIIIRNTEGKWIGFLGTLKK